MWRFRKQQPQPWQVGRPKDSFEQPTLPDEPEHPSFYQTIRYLCMQAVEKAWPEEARLIVTHDTWERMLEVPEIRLDMRFAYPHYLLPTERCILYGVHFLVTRPERKLSESLNWDMIEGPTRLPISEYTGAFPDCEVEQW